MDRRSPVHEIVNALWNALHDLGTSAETSDIERWGFSIHAALSASGREFHNHDHVVDLLTDGDPLEVIAALYHDAVYIQVDQGPPRSMREVLTPLLAQSAAGWRILPAAAAGVSGEVLSVFGRQVGDLVTPTTGLNEFASALVASVQLEQVLYREQRIAIAACIEQTIPFRTDPVTELPQAPPPARAGGRRARRDHPARGPGRQPRRRQLRGQRSGAVPRQHLEAAAGEQPGAALADGLHRPRLPDRAPEDGELPRLAPRRFRVFHSWGDEPSPQIHARRVARTTGNLQLAVRYLRAKLYSIGLVEAISEVTGGDVPLDYFMGGAKTGDRPSMRRIEQFLPTLDNASDLDPPLHRLLAEGRASESSFDTGPSPLGAFLHATVGESEVMKQVEDAKPVVGRWDGRRVVPPGPAAEAGRRDRARGRQHHRDPPRSPVRARGAARAMTRRAGISFAFAVALSGGCSSDTDSSRGSTR